MSEQKTSFMEDLDQWSDANVISPLVYSDEDSDESFEDAQRKLDQVKQAIRAKVLESYKNGCRAGAGHVRKEMQHAAAGRAQR